MHQRQRIRQATRDALLEIAEFGGRVYTNRPLERPIEKDALPAALIYTAAEESGRDSMPPAMGDAPTLERALELVTLARVKTGDQADDAADSLAELIEAKIGNTTLGGAVLDLLLVASELEISAEGEQPIAQLSLTWRAVYRTAENDPSLTVP